MPGEDLGYTADAEGSREVVVVIPPYQPTDFERRVLQVMLELDPLQNGLAPAEIAPQVWKPLSTRRGRTGQNQAMGAQLMRICRLGLVTVRQQEFGRAKLWFLTDVGMQLAGKR